MNQLYEVIKPVRKKKEEKIWKWIDSHPKSFLGVFCLGYLSLLGLVIGWAISIM